jgi:hypothetical protein
MYDWNKDIKEILSKYKLLKYHSNNRCLSGDIELISDTGKYIDIFNVEIFIPEHFPKCFPKVIETEKKIPRTVLRHVMPKTNYLCLVVKIEEMLLCQHGITLLWFVDNVLVPRLCEEYRVNNGEKYQQEYSHDFGGTWEFLMKKIELENPKLVLKFIEALANKKKPKGNKPCLCGSGKEYRLCHQKFAISLQHLNNKTLIIMHDLLLKHPYNGVNL